MAKSLRASASTRDTFEKPVVFSLTKSKFLSFYPANTEEAQYNMAFPIAAALLDGEVDPAQTLPPRLFDADIRSLMDRIDVTTADRFNREFPAKALAEAAIVTRDGRSLKSGVMSAIWDTPSGLPTDQELETKFLYQYPLMEG